MVKRPQKNFLWGYGTQVYDEDKTDDENCFTKGKLPTIKQLLNFLEIYQMKDLKVVNLKALGRNEENYAIVTSAFSMRHSYSTAKALVQRLKSLECPEIVNLPTICGTKDDSWLMIVVKEVQVHIILEEYRDELSSQLPSDAAFQIMMVGKGRDSRLSVDRLAQNISVHSYKDLISTARSQISWLISSLEK